MENTDVNVPEEKGLSGPIAELEKIVSVQERYKSVFNELLKIFQKLYDEKDKTLLFDIQPLTMFIQPENGKVFKKFMDDLRSYLNITVKNSQNCRQRLASLRSVFLEDEQRKLINDALDLLNLPASSEISSDADFRFLSLQQFTKEMDVAIEIQEIFIYLNSLFTPVDEQPKTQNNSNKNNKRR
jgi:hypothetical protein